MNRYSGADQSIEEEPFFVNKLWDQPPILHFEPQSFSLAAGDGIHWACHYKNNTDRILQNDGSATGEMCILAAVTYPAPWTVEEVKETVEAGALGDLLSLLNDVMGPCDSVETPLQSPWNSDSTQACGTLDQTQSNK